MLSFEVLHSPDSDVVLEHKYEKYSLSIGRNEGDFLINDEDILDHHITFQINEKGLFVKQHSLAKYIHVNDKRVGGTKILKTGDTVKVGETTLKIGMYVYDESEDLTKKVAKNINLFLDEDAPIHKVISILEDEFKKYEK